MSTLVPQRPSTPSPLGAYRAVIRWFAVVLAGLGALLAPAPAHADGDPSTDVVRAVDVTMTVEADGTVHVQETYQWDFGTRNGLGFYRDLITAQGYDEDSVRLYEYSAPTVSSPSGAPAAVWVESESNGVRRLAVGAPDGSSDTRTGVQTYVLSYDAVGLLNAVRDDPRVEDRDELYTNIFQDIANPMERVTVTVTGPADVIDIACYQGPFGSTNPCTAYESDGATATLTATGLGTGEGFTISVAWAAGTFTDIAPILVPRDQYGPVPDEPGTIEMWLVRAANAVGSNWWWVAAGWLALLVFKGWRRVEAGRDLHFVGLPPGMLPAGAAGEVAPLRGEPPVAVRFTPPDGLAPAEAGLLEAESVRDSWLPATLVDLAVRGYLTFRSATAGSKGDPGDWTLKRTGADRAGLRPFERNLLRAVFGDRKERRLSSLEGTFYPKVQQFRRDLTAASDAHGFFRTPGLLGGGPKDARAKRRTAITLRVWFLGAAVLIALFVLDINNPTYSLAPLTWSLLVGLLTYPLVGLVTLKAAHGRSATGRALYEQVRGFRLYLTTADADRLRWEEGQDIFSRYLPWAMAFGVAEHWAQVFADLAAQGRYTAEPTWYVGEGTPGPDLFHDLGTSMTRFTTYSGSSLASTPGSSGGSGSFSSGGGSSGGGGGGGGGAGGR